MAALDKIADSVVADFSAQNPNEAFDPAWITVIFGIVQQVITMISQCKQTPAGGTAIVNNPTALQRLVLRRKVVNSVGRKDFREHGEQLLNALYSTGKKVELADMEELLDG